MSEISLKVGEAEIVIDPAAGGRLSALRVAGLNLLVERSPDPLAWGSYPMAPWAGRLAQGRFAFDGDDYRIERAGAEHPLHGTSHLAPWSVDRHDGCSATLRFSLGDPWPFGGEVVQTFALHHDRLDLTMAVIATRQAMPAAAGWHPWFRRSLDRGQTVRIEFDAATMYERAPDMLPTGSTRAPGPPPWDDCFTGVRSGPTLVWPGALELALDSSADHWVLYTEPEHAICVEPQTGPPNHFNLADPPVPRLEPGDALELTCTMRWRPQED